MLPFEYLELFSDLEQNKFWICCTGSVGNNILIDRGTHRGFQHWGQNYKIYNIVVKHWTKLVSEAGNVEGGAPGPAEESFKGCYLNVFSI